MTAPQPMTDEELRSLIEHAWDDDHTFSAGVVIALGARWMAAAHDAETLAKAARALLHAGLTGHGPPYDWGREGQALRDAIDLHERPAVGGGGES